MPAPHDADIVLAAVRLGWYVAEVRGRNRPDAPRAPGQPVLDRAGHMLPLRAERTAPELRVEAHAVLGALARRLGVDDQPCWWYSYSRLVNRAAERLAARIKAHQPDPMKDRKVREEWESLSELLYKFDAHIQDTLTVSSDSQACGYQLGRALAECYWALDPRVIDGAAPSGQASPSGAGSGGAGARHVAAARSWQFLLGARRCQEMSRLLGRLSAYMHPYTAAAISGSLQIWKDLAANIGAWKDGTAGREAPAGRPGTGAQNPAAAGEWFQVPADALYLQLRRWYELVILGQDPTTLIRPYMLLRHFRLLWQTAKVFGFELISSALGAAALAVLAVALTRPSVKAWFGALMGLVGLTGFSIAGVSAKLKNTALAMFRRLRQDAYTDLIATAISTCPAPPRRPRTWIRRVTLRAVRQRPLTTATPN